MEYNFRNGLAYDPIEDTEEYKNIIDGIDHDVVERMKDFRKGLGMCHVVWNIKKELLKEIGIDWQTPKECNPHIMFD